MRIGLLKEAAEGERRVATVPEVAKLLTKGEHELAVEPGAGEGSAHPDAEYTEVGAATGNPWDAEDVGKVRAPSREEVGRLQAGQVPIGVRNPLTAGET